jgi:hypothetical protein
MMGPTRTSPFGSTSTKVASNSNSFVASKVGSITYQYKNGEMELNSTQHLDPTILCIEDQDGIRDDSNRGSSSGSFKGSKTGTSRCSCRCGGGGYRSRRGLLNGGQCC